MNLLHKREIVEKNGKKYNTIKVYPPPGTTYQDSRGRWYTITERGNVVRTEEPKNEDK